MSQTISPSDASFVRGLRDASPYIRAHRGQTFVVFVDGEVVGATNFQALVQDLAVLAGIGAKLVLVHGTRPQLDARLAASGLTSVKVGDIRVTPPEVLQHAKAVAAAVRFEIEAAFAQIARTRVAGNSSLRVVGGNFVLARPVGIIEGIDLQFAGELRRLDAPSIQAQLEIAEVVLVSPIGHSATGETFNLNAASLATAIATEIRASKLILMSSAPQIVAPDDALIRELTPREAREYQRGLAQPNPLLANAVRACAAGVARVHLLAANDGALLLELFTRDGAGTLVSNAPFDQIRAATIEDVGGILDLIAPLESEGVLVKRSREKLENEIDHFIVAVRDEVTVACGALYSFTAEGTGEIAGIAVDPNYRRRGFGNSLLAALEVRAHEQGLKSVFVLTTQATHWFQEHGYVRTSLDALPNGRLALYNFQRNSQVLFKTFTG